MRIDIIAVGKRMPDWIDKAVNQYQKRLPDHLNFSLTEITPASRTKKNSIENYQRQEEEKIMAAIKPGSQTLVLDEHGKQFGSAELAKIMKQWMDDNQSVSFIIGGADGISDTLKKQSHSLWSLSALTLPHGLVRVLLTEQIYRAWTILNNHPYHRE